jgi:hypothetical protein
MLRPRRVLVGACLVALAVGVAAPSRGAGPPSAAGTRSAIVPVPSLQPSATERLWRTLVRRAASPTPLAAGDCLPLRAVFYAATDWLRLATRLAANASPCAEYRISIPPLAADKTRPRPDQAWRIRALGPAFHADAEISWNAWSAWVAGGAGTWHDAGAEARRRMAAAGYDVALGDGWALNELTSAVRRGDGSARANAREFLRGLYEADGVLPRARGTAFVVGIGQRTADLGSYRAYLQNWLQDAPFWNEVGAYVENWSQEAYGDVRAYAVPGTTLAARRNALRDYLGHALHLARGGPDAVASARSFLEAAYSPLANAAWEWDDAFGWTAVPVAQMKDFVSAETYALRHVSAGAAPGRAGFAWAPRNAEGLTAGEFAARSGDLLDRLAAAIHDSTATDDPADPGIGACGPGGVNLWCVAEVPGATFNQGWGELASWAQPGVAFASPPPTLTAGVASAPLAVQLQLSGVPQLAPSPITVELSTSSPGGAFATSPDGPWSPALGVVIGPGASTSPGIYYLDTQPGTPTLAARASGGSATQAAVVEAASGGGGGSPPVDLVLTGSVEPPTAAGGATVTWRLQVEDRTQAPATGVHVDLALPPGHAYVSGSTDRGPGCAVSGPAALRCTLDALGGGSPPGLVLVTTTVSIPGAHVLRATAAFDGDDPTPADNVLALQMLATPETRVPAVAATPARVVRRGTARADRLAGGPGADLLRGLAGDDVLLGRGGDDRLDGGGGGDRLVGGPGRDTLLGATGDDLVQARDGRRDAISCGPGRDRVEADRLDRIGVGCERVSRR